MLNNLGNSKNIGDLDDVEVDKKTNKTIITYVIVDTVKPISSPWCFVFRKPICTVYLFYIVPNVKIIMWGHDLWVFNYHGFLGICNVLIFLKEFQINPIHHYITYATS